MIEVFEQKDGGTSGQGKFYAVLKVEVVPYWIERYEAYGSTEKAAKKDVRMQVKKMLHALRKADLTANPTIKL